VADIQGNRCESIGHQPADDGDHQLKYRRYDEWSTTFESLYPEDKTLWSNESSYSLFPWLTRRDPEKAEAIADHHKTQF
jgi:hypothetical protein